MHTRYMSELGNKTEIKGECNPPIIESVTVGTQREYMTELGG